MTKQLLTEPDQTETLLYNPTTDDFSFICADNNNDKHEYILRGMEITKLPKYLADMGASKLAEKLVWERGIKTNYQDDKNKILEELYVKL